MCAGTQLRPLYRVQDHKAELRGDVLALFRFYGAPDSFCAFTLDSELWWELCGGIVDPYQGPLADSRQTTIA